MFWIKTDWWINSDENSKLIKENNAALFTVVVEENVEIVKLFLTNDKNDINVTYKIEKCMNDNSSIEEITLLHISVEIDIENKKN